MHKHYYMFKCLISELQETEEEDTLLNQLLTVTRPWDVCVYNITKAKRAFWFVNSPSTICPWVYAADVLNN